MSRDAFATETEHKTAGDCDIAVTGCGHIGFFKIRYSATAKCNGKEGDSRAIGKDTKHATDAGDMAVYNLFQKLGFSNTPSGPITEVDCSCKKKQIALGNCNIDVLVCAEYVSAFCWAPAPWALVRSNVGCICVMDLVVCFVCCF